jgi:hypothetical protein
VKMFGGAHTDHSGAKQVPTRPPAGKPATPPDQASEQPPARGAPPSSPAPHKGH